MKIALLDKLFKGVVEAVKFVTTGGTSSQFVKGDGSLDDTQYVTQTDIDGSIDNIEIGGRNLLPNSDSYDRWYGFSGASVTKTKVDMTDEWGFSNAVRMVTSGGTNIIRLLYSTAGKLSEPMVLGQFYTYSIYIKNMGEKDIRLHTNGLGYPSTSATITIKAGESGRFSITGQRRVNYDWFQPQLRPLSVNDDIDVIIGHEKIEKGNKATDWTPAPEDKEDAFEKNTAFNKNFGSAAGTVTEGNDSRLSNSREWTASTVTKAEAEAGTATTRRAWTAQRVRQAIVGWWENLGTAFGRGFITLTNASSARDKLQLGNSATRDVGQDAGTVMEGNDERIINGGVLRTIVSLDSNFNIDTLKYPEHVGLYEGKFNFPFYETRIEVVAGVLEVVEVSGTIMHIFKTLEGGVYTRFYEFDAWSPWKLSATQEWTINNFPTFSDLYGVNTVMEGGYYLIPGEAYKYSVWASKYVINGVLYTERIEGEVTLNPAHSTLNRFDLIVVTTDELEPFKVIEGVPAENPVRPNFDTESEVDLTFIYVNSLSDGGGQVGNYLLVYDENEGWPNEANTSMTNPGGLPSAVLGSTEDSYRGNKSIKILETPLHNDDRKIIFTFSSLKELSDYTKLNLYIKAPPDLGDIKTNGWIVFKNSQTNSIVETRFPGEFLRGYEGWKPASRDLEGLSGEFDIIEFQTSSRGGSTNFPEGTFIDYITLTSDTGSGGSGGQQLIERTSQIPINDGEDGSSPYATQKWVEEYSGGMALLVGDVILNNWRANINNRVFIHNGDGGTGIGIWLTGNEGAEFTILNNSNQELTVMSGSKLFVKLTGMGIGTTSPGGFKIIDTFPREYKGRFKVVNGEFLEIGR